MSEAHLIERSIQGDPDAYESLVRAYSDLAFRVAYVVTGDAGDAEDAAQDGFVKAWYALDSFDPERPFRPWLLRIVTNEARNRRTSATRRHRLATRVEAVDSGSQTDPSPEQIAIAHEERRAVLAMFDRLREDDRLVLAYRYFFDLSEAEMAEALGVARGTVKSRLSRALGRLRQQLTEHARDTESEHTELRGKEAD